MTSLDGAKIDVAAAFAGTFRSWLGKVGCAQVGPVKGGHKVQKFPERM